MLLRTVVDVPNWPNPMRHDHSFVLLGSCFAQGMGEKFLSYGVDALCNPFGATYNPESIAVQVTHSLMGSDELPLFCTETGEWHCWLANTLMVDTDEDRLRVKVRHTFSELGDALRKADFIFITLGTNVCYRLKENGLTVTNCHKQPDALFEEVKLDVVDCTKIICEMVELLTAAQPTSHVVFTVSPYRYKKYGFHESQLSKSVLLLSVHEACKRYPEKVTYFPAYEILLDELRDYRFYADDMIHPSSFAVDYIWRRLVEAAMDSDMQQYLKEYEPIRRAKMHKNRDERRSE